MSANNPSSSNRSNDQSSAPDNQASRQAAQNIESARQAQTSAQSRSARGENQKQNQNRTSSGPTEQFQAASGQKPKNPPAANEGISQDESSEDQV